MEKPAARGAQAQKTTLDIDRLFDLAGPERLSSATLASHLKELTHAGLARSRGTADRSSVRLATVKGVPVVPSVVTNARRRHERT